MGERSKLTTAPPDGPAPTGTVSTDEPHAAPPASAEQDFEAFFMYYDDLVGRAYVVSVRKRTPPDSAPPVS